jgi:hypothetical protein
MSILRVIAFPFFGVLCVVAVLLVWGLLAFGDFVAGRE